MLEKYFVVKAVHVFLASSSHTTVDVIQAAANSASRTVNEPKRNGPPKKIGRNVKSVYIMQTHATASPAAALPGRRRSASEKSLVIAAPKTDDRD
jgi:sirohydrochlorin ferrochelatase